MIKFLQTKKTTLSYSISDSATIIQLDELLKLDGTPVAASDIGDALQGTFAPGTAREEIFEIDGANVTVNSNGTVTITNVLRGRKEVEPYGSGGFATDHGPGEVVVFGNNPQLYNRMAILANNNAFTGDNTFVNNPQKTTSSLAANNNDFITKNDLLNAVIGSVTTDQVVISGTAGENLTAGNIAYFKESDQKWWKADADIVGTFDQVVVAIVQNTAVTDASVNILLQGVDKTQVGLTPGAKYYLSNTAGEMSTTPGTTEVFLGWAQTATRFIFDPLGLYQPTSGEKAAMAGTSGTPSSTNEFVTQNDTTNGATITGATIAFVNSNPDTITDSGNGFVTAGFQAGQSITVTGSVSNNGTFTIASVTAGTITLVTGDSLTAESAGASVTISAVKVGKVIRFDDNGAYPEGDGSAITGINPSVTLGENVAPGDLLKLVNESGNARLKKLIGVPSSTTTASGGTISGALMGVWLSSNLCIFAWKDGASSTGVVAGTFSGGTWTFGTDITLNVSAGVFYDFGLTRVTDTSFVVVMRSATNGGAGNYLGAAACTVSGTTITAGSVTSLDSNANSGDNNARLLKVFLLPGTSTCVCTYRWQTANTCARSVVFTVSGTAISGGTPLDADTGAPYGAMTGCPLSASKFVIAYSNDSAGTRHVRVATISGTTITYGTLTTITFTSGNFSATQLGTDVFILVGKDLSTTTTMLKRIITVSSTTPTEGTLYTDTTSMTSGTGQNFSVALIGTILYVVRDASGTLFFYKYRYNSTAGTLTLISSYSSSTIAPLLSISSLYAVDVYNSDRLIITGNDSNNIINVVGLPDWDEFITSSNSTLLSGVSLVVSKIMTGFSSLIPSAKYYTKADMTIQGVTTDSTYQYVGRAISATTIYNDNQ